MKDDDVSETDANFTYHISSDESPSQGVIKAISELSEYEPLPRASANADARRALDPLYTVVDPDALDTVFRSPDRTDGRVTFCYQGHAITVHSEGRVCVRALEQ